MVNYFILANLYALLFYVLYAWTLKGSRRHTWSRFYLLLSGTLALCMPFLRLDLTASASGRENAIPLAFQLPEVVLRTAEKTAVLTNEVWLFTLYGSMVLFLLGRFIYQALSLHFFLKRQAFIRQGRYRIAFNTGYGPASFGRSIIFPGSETNKMILLHEAAHLDRRHHYDMIFMRLLQCICFPVFALYFIRRELEIVHEFEADKTANTDTETYALLLVNRHFHTNQIQLLHSFFHHPLKRRITMLQQSRKGKRGLLIAALTLTTTGIILMQSQSPVMAQKKTPVPFQKTGTEAGRIFTSVDQMPEPGFDVAQYLAENIKYPETARRQGITGYVIALFVIDPSGRLRNIEIKKPLTDDCAAEVLRVIKAMPAWKKPGMQKGKAVSVYYTLPVRFALK
jgi:TonB family protein